MSNALKFTPNDGSVSVEIMYIPPLTSTIFESSTFRTASESCQNSQHDETLQTPQHAPTSQLSPSKPITTTPAKDRHPVAKEIPLDKDKTVKGYEHGHIIFRVVDSGPGMTSDQLSRLFQDGVQFNANELQGGGGTGLGLFIAKGIISQHDGRLTASSDGLGHGALFEIILPLWKLESDESAIDAGPKPKQGLNTLLETTSMTSNTDENALLEPTEKTLSTVDEPKSSVHVLVVDDVKSNRKLLRRLLENRGHQCDEAADGKEAVEMTKKAYENGYPYDSILLDYEMPVMDGPTAAREIRRFLSTRQQKQQEQKQKQQHAHEQKDDEDGDRQGQDQQDPESTTMNVGEGHHNKNETPCSTTKRNSNKRLNIIGVTGNVLVEDVSHFISCGADEVLSKPVKIQQLVSLWTEIGLYAPLAPQSSPTSPSSVTSTVSA